MSPVGMDVKQCLSSPAYTSVNVVAMLHAPLTTSTGVMSTDSDHMFSDRMHNWQSALLSSIAGLPLQGMTVDMLNSGLGHASHYMPSEVDQSTSC